MEGQNKKTKDKIKWNNKTYSTQMKTEKEWLKKGNDGTILTKMTKFWILNLLKKRAENILKV